MKLPNLFQPIFQFGGSFIAKLIDVYLVHIFHVANYVKVVDGGEELFPDLVGCIV